MKFCEYLDYLRKSENLKNSVALYDFLGGEDALGIKYRQFMAIESGKFSPNEKTFLAVFQKCKPQDFSLLLNSFFRSKLGDLTGGEAFLNYLQKIITMPLMKRDEEIWDKNCSKRPLYTDQQLDFLREDEVALKLYKRLLLYEELAVENQEHQSVYKKFVSLGLAARSKNKLFPAKTLYKVPKEKAEGGPRTRERATKYILKHIDTFASYEGSENQKIGYFFGLFRPEVADKILDQTESLRKWIQHESLESPKDKDAVPVVFVTFTKKLLEGEI